MFPSIVCIYRTVISTCVLGQFFFIVSAYNSNYNGCSRNNCVWPAEMTSFVRLKQRDSHIKSLAYTHANQFLLLFHMDAHTDYGSATAIQRQTFFRNTFELCEDTMPAYTCIWGNKSNGVHTSTIGIGSQFFWSPDTIFACSPKQLAFFFSMSEKREAFDKRTRAACVSRRNTLQLLFDKDG